MISNDWYMCSICNFFLPTVVVLTNHRGRAHAPMKNGTSKKITCSFCPEVFRASDVYHAHANNCHLDIIVEKWQIHCKICRIYFPTSVLLKRHKEQVKAISDPDRFSWFFIFKTDIIFHFSSIQTWRVWDKLRVSFPFGCLTNIIDVFSRCQSFKSQNNIHVYQILQSKAVQFLWFLASSFSCDIKLWEFP